ncbi:MAG: RNase adapter RapZ [Proteobacteria bacterium]|nr:RNase adapter RapZ [Pseudomonadota bacterium]
MTDDATITQLRPRGSKRRVVLTSGLSGAGLSSVLKTLEDLGYEAVDNLRLSMIPALIRESAANGKPMAISVDSRNAEFNAEAFLKLLQEFRADAKMDLRLLFLDCDNEALQRRFNETRRRHPLALDRPVMEGITIERQLLTPVREASDHVIDTSLMALTDLRRLLAGHYRTDIGGMTISVSSFAYKHGVPRESDLIFDVRFLRNPHWDAKLRALSGHDLAVAEHIRHDPDFEPFFNSLLQFLFPLLPRYKDEGKSYLTIAVGCTGGRHRSVFVAEQLGTMLAAQGYVVALTHRDIDRAEKVAAEGGRKS